MNECLIFTILIPLWILVGYSAGRAHGHALCAQEFKKLVDLYSDKESGK